MWCSYSKQWLQNIHRLDAHLQLGLTIIIQKQKIVTKCQTIVWLSIFSILMCFPTSCPCLVCVKHSVSIILILLYFLQVSWPPGNNACSLYQNFSLQLAFPPHNSYTLCVSGNTLIKVIHKHIRTVFLPLPAWGFLQLFWTFTISLPAFLQILQMVQQYIHV